MGLSWLGWGVATVQRRNACNTDCKAGAGDVDSRRGGRRPRRSRGTLADHRQLIANLSYLAVGPTNEAIWDMEDEQFLAAMRKHIADLSNRAVNVG